MAGYSKRSLVQKLGLKSGQRAIIIAAPDSYPATLGELPPGVDMKTHLNGDFDFIHVFCRSQAEMVQRFPRLVRALRPNGMLWVSWPKKSSGMAGDMSEDAIRNLAVTTTDLVDVKVCAVDETWSALKLVFRRAQRPRL